MGLSEDGDENTERRFEELCMDLNMDRNAKEEAWQSYERINTNYTLEVRLGDLPPYLFLNPRLDTYIHVSISPEYDDHLISFF